MSLRCGIVGLPNVGKSTLFNALTKAAIPAENYPFCTIEPNIGVVPVPDPRLKRIAGIARPAKVTPATVEFVDIAGLVAGASKGEGLGNQFLAHIRETDGVINMVRCFENENVVHVAGRVDPVGDIEIIHTELALADLATVEKAHERNISRVKAGDKEAVKLDALLRRARAHLDQGQPVRSLGLEEPGLDRLARAVYGLLGLQTYFTAGPKEVRAWTIHAGDTAPQAAGAIHTDFERGFIRAEIIAYTDYVACGGEQGAKEAGKMRLEGKDYVVRDGDVIYFRFNV